MASILGAPVWLVLALVGLLPALEASTFLGLVFPGEAAVLAGGVVAHTGAVPLWSVVVAAVCGAAIGDQVGFHVGRRYGTTLVQRLPHRLAGSRGLEDVVRLLRRRGVVVVLLGRWVAALRALVPGAAGMSGMDPGRFTLANVAGGSLWATAVGVAGYLAGASYGVLDRRLGLGSDALLLVLLVLVAVWLVRHRRAESALRRRASGLPGLRPGR